MLHNDSELFEQIILRTAEETGLDAAVVEKDYYVTLFLKRITEKEQNIIFRGGTSLSKCYGLIDRFSEDIDLGIGTDSHPTEGTRRNIKNSIVSVIDGMGLELGNPEDIRSRRDYNRYEIVYPSKFGVGYLKQHLAVETAMFMRVFPVERKKISCFAYEFLIRNGYDDIAEENELRPFELTVQSAARTLADKIFALCDYYMSQKTDEHSRHIYDICKLTKVIDLNENFSELIAQVRDDRSSHRVCLSAQPDVSINNILEEIVKTGAFRADYEKRTEKLLFKKMLYETAIEALTEIVDSGVMKRR